MLKYLQDYGKQIFITEAMLVLLPVAFSFLFSPHSNENKLTQHSWCILSNNEGLNFDGVHYFNNRYQYEPNHAFLPCFVGVVQYLKLLFGQSGAIALILLINRGLFVLSGFQIHKILVAMGLDSKMTKFGTIVFLYNPAAIFFHTIYTESLFCFFSCKAISILLEDKGYISAIVFICLSASLRTNGIFLAPVMGLQILHKLLVRSGKSVKDCCKIFSKGVGVLAMVVLPLVYHLVFSYLNVCVWPIQKPQICRSAYFPNIYSYVQQRYWGVGIFDYFSYGNLVFIIIGAPSILISAFGLFSCYDSRFELQVKGVFLSFVILLCITISMTNIQSGTRFFSTHPIFYYILAKVGASSKLIRTWIIFYYFLGMLMYVVGFPWT